MARYRATRPASTPRGSNRETVLSNHTKRKGKEIVMGGARRGGLGEGVHDKIFCSLSHRFLFYFSRDKSFTVVMCLECYCLSRRPGRK